jgi:hypothetical protein
VAVPGITINDTEPELGGGKTIIYEATQNLH